MFFKVVDPFPAPDKAQVLLQGLTHDEGCSVHHGFERGVADLVIFPSIEGRGMLNICGNLICGRTPFLTPSFVLPPQGGEKSLENLLAHTHPLA